MVSPSILITDDDAAVRETLHAMLEPFGYQIRLAGDGEEALRIALQMDVHLMLLDMHMPRLTGLETIQRVRMVKHRLPCILISAGLNEKLVEQANRIGTYSVLAKPVTRQILAATVQAALQWNYGWPQADQ